MIHRHPLDQRMRLDGQCHLPEHHIWVMMPTVVKSCDTISCLKTINKWIEHLPQKFVNILHFLHTDHTAVALLFRTYRQQGCGSILGLTTVNYKWKDFFPYPYGTINLWRQPHWLQCLQGAKCRTGPQSKIKNSLILSKVEYSVLPNPYLFISLLKWGYAVVWLVEALHYKLEGRGFDSRWGHLDFSST
jgi:hypothetical protein